MAVGYSRTATVQVLLDFGADPEVGDKDGRNVMDLVEKLRGAMPLSPELLGRRTMLENVASVLTGRVALMFASWWHSCHHAAHTGGCAMTSCLPHVGTDVTLLQVVMMLCYAQLQSL